MSTSRMWQALLLTSLIATVSACGGGGGNNNDSNAMEPTVPPPPPPPPAQTSYTQFVIDRFAITADTTDPVDITDVDFSFPDQENPAAFDELLQ